MKLEKDTNKDKENKVSLEKQIEDKSDAINNMVDSINKVMEEASTEVNESINIEKDINIENKVDMEKVREAEKQAEESVQESLNNAADSLQNTFDNVNKSMDSFYESLGNSSELIDKTSLKLDSTSAAVVSFFIPGLGQMINGQTTKGLVMLLVGIFGNILIGLLTCCIGLVISVPVTIFISVFDSYKCAKMLENDKQINRKNLWFQYK